MCYWLLCVNVDRRLGRRRRHRDGSVEHKRKDRNKHDDYTDGRASDPFHNVRCRRRNPGFDIGNVSFSCQRWEGGIDSAFQFSQSFVRVHATPSITSRRLKLWRVRGKFAAAKADYLKFTGHVSFLVIVTRLHNADGYRVKVHRISARRNQHDVRVYACAPTHLGKMV